MLHLQSTGGVGPTSTIIIIIIMITTTTTTDTRPTGDPVFDTLTRLDPTKLDLTRLDVRSFELPAFDLPAFELPALELPDLPVDVDRFTGFARDAAYVGLGAVVVAGQKVAERRRELTEQVGTGLRKLVAAAR